MQRVFSTLTDYLQGTPALGHVPLYNAAEERWDTVKAERVDVRSAGATGDGSTDDYTAIAAAITAAGVGGTVVFPKPSSFYKVGTSLTPLNFQTWIVEGFKNTSTTPIIKAPALADAIIKHTSGTLTGFCARGLSLSGAGAVSGSRGIRITSGVNVRLNDLWVENVGDEAILIEGGVDCRVVSCRIQNALLVRSGRTDYVGTIDVGSSDSYLINNEATASVSAVGGGYIAAIVLRGTNSWALGNVAEISQVGFVYPLTSALCHFYANRADLNYGHGFIVGGAASEWIANLAYRNGRETDDTYDGFVVTNGQNAFVGNRILGDTSDTNRMRYGIHDSASVGTSEETGNSYLDTRGGFIRRELEFSSGSTPAGFSRNYGRDFRAGLSGGYNTGHLMIGSYHLWVDATGDLRIKSSAPLSDLDGSLVGVQS